METSAAVPSSTELIERSLTELSDEDVEHLAEAMTRAWSRSDRIGFLALLVPTGGCTALASIGNPQLVGMAVGFGTVGLLAGAFLHGIARVLYRRSLALEVESLGYEGAVGRATGVAWLRAMRSFLPRITRKQKAEACRKQLRRARDRALRSR